MTFKFLDCFCGFKEDQVLEQLLPLVQASHDDLDKESSKFLECSLKLLLGLVKKN